MTTTRVLRTRIALGFLAAAFYLTATAYAQWDIQTYWECHRGGWSAFTTYRSMEGGTSFECGGACDDSSHNQPTSWVDFTGGISQSQEDTSDSFFGPLSGEWNGCAASGSQVSTGGRSITDINQEWDRWPTQWGNGQYWMQDISFVTGSTDTMRTPFGSVYDLDCISGWVSWLWGGSCPKDVIGTIYWDNFTVTAYLAAGSPVVTGTEWGGTGSGYARWNLVGDTGVFCSTPDNGCQSQVCSDLHVRGTFECTWTLYDPCQHIPPHMDIPNECIRNEY